MPRRRRPDECAHIVTTRKCRPGVELERAGVTVAVTRMRHGAEQHWLRCGGCGRRRATLYRPTEADGWRCRKCHMLGYRSSQECRQDESRAAVRQHLAARLEQGEDLDAILDALDVKRQIIACSVLIEMDAKAIAEAKGSV